VIDLSGQFKIFYREKIHHSCRSTSIFRAVKFMSLHLGRTKGKEILQNVGEKFLVT
jgi:hypothetical protein